jgi:hypothetical protein
MNAEPWTIAAFKERRRQTWKANRFWWLLLGVGLIGFEVPFYLERAHVRTAPYGNRVTQSLSTEDMTEGEFTIALVSLVGVFAGGSTTSQRDHPRRIQMPTPAMVIASPEITRNG